MIKNISIVIIASNAEHTICETLDSLKSFEEVIVYENNSTDNTKNLVKNYKNVKLINGDFIGFGPTKNKASTYAKNDWILSLDSDEVLNQDLVEELSNIDLKDEKNVFLLKRDNYFLGKEVKYSGWGRDFLIRVYNKKKYKFNDNKVHEFIDIDNSSNVKKLKNSFKHNAVTNLNQFLYKIARYSDLASDGKRTCFFMIVILKSSYAFFKTYIFQLGFLDGWRGFFIAISNGMGKFYRYTKRYVNCKER